MKLDVAVNEITLSNTGATGEFRIRNSAKAFKILSDGLYSNKIRAVIRELSCNALDSHVAADKRSTPFEVHLPTVLEPWFSVRDFGVGLDATQVTQIYTTYFESTKTESNQFVGALGLGSKSPFSYTENFTVIAVKHGIKRIYSAYINDMGVPSIVEMSSEVTDDDTGVEVKFSVTDRSDYNSFRYEAGQVFKWFDVKPCITGSSLDITPVQYADRNIVPGVHSFAAGSRADSVAVMGNIAYPLEKLSEPEKHFGKLASLLRCGIQLDFEIGDLDFAASREELSYVPLTIASIKRKLEELNANLAQFVAAKAATHTCMWARAVFLNEQKRSYLYEAAVEKYIADTQFPLLEIRHNHVYLREFEFTEAALTKRELSIQGFRCTHSGTGRVGHATTWSNSTYMPVVQIPVDVSTIFVLNDLKTGCLSRARYHFTKTSSMHQRIYCINHTSKDLAVRQAEYDKFLAELHNPPTVIKASELEKQVRAKSPATNGIAELVLKDSASCDYSEESYTWAQYHDALVPTEKYYYVPLVGHNAFDLEGKPLDVRALKALMAGSGVPALADITVYGVRKNAIKEIQGLKNWVYLGTKLKKETSKISADHIQSLLVAGLLDTYPNKVHTSATVANMVRSDSYYKKFVDEYISTTRASGHVSHLVSLCDKYGTKVSVADVKKRITDARDALYKTYPLLQHIRDVDDIKVAEYIKLVDNTQEKN